MFLTFYLLSPTPPWENHVESSPENATKSISVSSLAEIFTLLG